jgi:PAS domain S-box-containing protein
MSNNRQVDLDEVASELSDIKQEYGSIEEKLRASVIEAEDEKAKAEAVIAAIGDGIIIQDTDYKIIYQNEIQNKTHGHHLGEYCYEVYEGQDTVCEGCPVELTFKDGKVHKTERRITTDQGVMYFELTSSPLTDSSGKIIAGVKVVRDITKQKMAEESLLESKKYWEDTFDAITDMITIHDQDFNIVKSNKAAQKILRLPDLEIEKITKCYKYYHGTGTAPKGCPSCNCMKTGKPATFEIYEPHLDMYLEVRAMPRLDSNNNLIGLIHVVRDITDRKMIEDAHNKLLDDVIKGKLEWEMTFDTVTELIILIDRDFNIVRCNMSFAAFAGKAMDSLIDRKCYEYFSPCDPAQLDHCKSLVLKGEPMTRVEINTGNGRWFYVSHRPMKDKKGEFIHSVIIASDITELKNMQGKLVESETELKEQIEELEKFYDMAVGRELKMKELKNEIRKLKAELSAYGHKSTDE